MEKYNVELNDNTINIDKGTTFKNFVDKYFNDEKIVLCNFNGKCYELGEEIPASGKMEVVNVNEEEGWKVYSRTLQFIFIKAALEFFPKAQITLEHSISKGIFGEIKKESPLTDDEIKLVKDRMLELINADIPIKKIEIEKDKAIEIFSGYGMKDKVTLLKQVDFSKVKLYELDGRYDYFYGKMAYSTGIIKSFDLIRYAHGFVLRNPTVGDIETLPEFKEQKKLAKIFYETKQWLRIIGVSDVGTLNDRVISNNSELKDLILVSEALHEKKIAQIADQIMEKGNVKVALIAGPSSSGKTTFSKRLSIQLRVNGLYPVPISLDDYFINRDQTPRDEDGNFDFENINIIDVKLFNEHLTRLMAGEEVEIPTYNFRKGEREWLGNKLKLPENGIIIVEGIHGLNPILTSEIKDENKFKIYISALTQLSIDNHNRIATTDVRKIRRIVRDFLSRGYGAEETLKMWHYVRAGERRNIFIYQEEADAMFNSTLVYELCVLKDYGLKELEKIKPGSPVYSEAERLKAFLSFFKTIEFKDVPENSILREFIGGSCFYQY